MAPSRLRPALLALLLALLPAAGCLGSPDEPLDSTDPEVVAADSDAPDAALAGGAPNETVDVEGEPAPLVARTLHLAADASLVDEVPSAGALPMGGSYAGCFATPPCSFLAFESQPVPTSILLPPQTVTVRYWVEATGPVAPGPFGFAAWFGSTTAMPLFAIKDSGPLMPGVTSVEVPLEVKVPTVVPAGASLRLYGLAGHLHEGTGVLKLLVGGESASSVTFSARAFALPKPGPAETQPFSGELPLGSFPAGEPVPKEHRQATHAFTVGPNATRVTVALQQSGPRPGDLDLDVLLGEEVVAGGHTPLGNEAIFLAGPALDALRGKELTVRVSNFFAPKSAYEVVVTQE